MSAPRAARSLDRSATFIKESPGVEHFWSTKLDDDTKTVTWTARDPDLEEDDEDFFSHTLFLKMAVLGDKAKDKESNIVMLKSQDAQGNEVNGAIVHLVKGNSLMCPLDLSLNGNKGGTFTLVSGSGPVFISGNYLQEYPEENPLDNTQDMTDESENELETTTEKTEDEDAEEEDEDEDEEDEEEEETTKKTAAKRKALPAKANKNKQKAKMEVDEEEDDEEDEEEEESDDDYKPVKKTDKKKAAKKETPKTKKEAKGKMTPEVAKKGAKKVKA